MCGILFTNKSDLSKKHFLRALDLMESRGPDAKQGYYEYRGMQLGHNRLKILDLNNDANQPFFSSDRRYVMVYNGEIYNYKELVAKYSLQTITTSDTEVLIELFSRLGVDMLTELNGMFAFVIVDLKTRRIFAARDRLGIKPLFVCETSNAITFASEMSAMLHVVGKREIDKLGARQYLKLRTFFNGKTLYKGINMFPAGTYYDNGNKVRYWEFKNDDSDPPDDAELFDLIKTSVDYRCISDVPVGSLLSGGLDSTIIAALAEKPYTWTVGFPCDNEFEWGQIAAKYLDSIHEEVIVEYDTFLDKTRELVLRRQEPLSVPNEVLLVLMTARIKSENTVILSGEGADELMFGYDRIFKWAQNNDWDIKEFDSYYSYGSHDDIEIIEDVISPYYKYGNNLKVIAAFFQTAHLHGLLRRLDFASMYNSVEARVPFVDHRLIERIAGTSFNYRMQKNVIKAPLKRVFKKYVPEGIINRNKVGFPVPLNKIFNRKIKDYDCWLQFNLEILFPGFNYSDLF